MDEQKIPCTICNVMFYLRTNYIGHRPSCGVCRHEKFVDKKYPRRIKTVTRTTKYKIPNEKVIICTGYMVVGDQKYTIRYKQTEKACGGYQWFMPSMIGGTLDASGETLVFLEVNSDDPTIQDVFKNFITIERQVSCNGWKQSSKLYPFKIETCREYLDRCPNNILNVHFLVAQNDECLSVSI
jgi:hypothetical protein